MNTNQDITIYIRKVDKKGIKITIPQNKSINSCGFYQFLFNKPEFVRFIQGQLKPIKKLNQTLTPTLEKVIQFYYQGNLINRTDNETILKLRNLSIVHVIVKKITINQPKIHKKTYQTQNNSNSQNKESECIKLELQCKIQKHQCRIQNQAAEIQIEKQKQIDLNIKILCNKNCTITNQYKQISNQINQIIIAENRVLKLRQSQLKKNSIYQCLKDIGLYEIVRQKMNKNKNQDNKDWINNEKRSELELIEFKVKVIHLGRAVQIVFKDNSQLQQSNQLDKNNTTWQQLNLVSNSQIIVLVSYIQINQTIKKNQQKVNHLFSQKVNNVQQLEVNHVQQLEVDSQQYLNEEDQMKDKLHASINIQQTINNQVSQEGSLYLLLQNQLTLRLYEQYKKWDTQWKYNYYNINESIKMKQSIKFKEFLDIKKPNSIDQLNNYKDKNANNLTIDRLKLCYQFDPFIQQYQFYQKQNKFQIESNTGKNKYIKGDIATQIYTNNSQNHQLNYQKNTQRKIQQSQQSNSMIIQKQTDQAGSDSKQNKMIDDEQNKRPSILIY